MNPTLRKRRYKSIMLSMSSGWMRASRSPLLRDAHVRAELFEFDARVPQRRDCRHFGEIATVGVLVARLRVLLQTAHRGGQRLRSRALGVGKGAHARHDLEAGAAQEQHQSDDRDKRPDDAHPAPLEWVGRCGRAWHWHEQWAGSGSLGTTVPPSGARMASTGKQMPRQAPVAGGPAAGWARSNASIAASIAHRARGPVQLPRPWSR